MQFSTYSESGRQEIEALFTRTFSDSEGEPEGKLIGDLVHELMNGTEAVLSSHGGRLFALSHSMIPGIGKPIYRTGNHITIPIR